MSDKNFKTWRCNFCAHTYSEAAGDPAIGLAPGTRFEDLPDDWTCPECGATKADFELI